MVERDGIEPTTAGLQDQLASLAHASPSIDLVRLGGIEPPLLAYQTSALTIGRQANGLTERTRTAFPPGHSRGPRPLRDRPTWSAEGALVAVRAARIELATTRFQAGAPTLGDDPEKRATRHGSERSRVSRCHEPESNQCLSGFNRALYRS